MDSRVLQSWATEMVKLSVGEWLESQEIPALRVKEPPRMARSLGRLSGQQYRVPTNLTLANYPQELRRRYPKLKLPQQQAQMAERMAKKVKAEGVSLKDIGVRHGPGESSAAGPKSVSIGSSQPLTVGHELGHVRDTARHGDKFHGTRGFFGWGGDPKSMIKSEVSATRQAFEHAPKGISRKSKAEMLAATGTYLQSLGVKGEGEYRKALYRTGNIQLHRGERTRVAREKARTRAFELGRSLRKKAPQFDVLEERGKKVTGVMERKQKALETEVATLQKKYPGLKAPSPWGSQGLKLEQYDASLAIRKAREAAGRPVDWRQQKAVDRLVAYKQKQLQKDPASARARRLTKTLSRWRHPGESPTTGPLAREWGANLMKKKERRYAIAAKRVARLGEKGKNPFVDPTYGKMTGAERVAVRRYVENIGGKLEEQFGSKKAKIYREEVLAGLKKPTLKGFQYLGKKEQILKALAADDSQALGEALERGLPPRPGVKKKKLTHEEMIKEIEEKARGKAKELGRLAAKGKKKASKGLLDLLRRVAK